MFIVHQEASNQYQRQSHNVYNNLFGSFVLSWNLSNQTSLVEKLAWHCIKPIFLAWKAYCHVMVTWISTLVWVIKCYNTNIVCFMSHRHIIFNVVNLPTNNVVWSLEIKIDVFALTNACKIEWVIYSQSETCL